MKPPLQFSHSLPRPAPSPEASAYDSLARPTRMYLNVKSIATITYRQARRIVIFVVGLTILIIGIAGVVLPILPGWPLMFVGLFVLAIEFAWARRWLRKLKRTARNGAAYARAKINGSAKAAA